MGNCCSACTKVSRGTKASTGPAADADPKNHSPYAADSGRQEQPRSGDEMEDEYDLSVRRAKKYLEAKDAATHDAASAEPYGESKLGTRSAGGPYGAAPSGGFRSGEPVGSGDISSPPTDGDSDDFVEVTELTDDVDSTQRGMSHEPSNFVMGPNGSRPRWEPPSLGRAAAGDPWAAMAEEGPSAFTPIAIVVPSPSEFDDSDFHSAMEFPTPRRAFTPLKATSVSQSWDGYPTPMESAMFHTARSNLDSFYTRQSTARHAEASNNPSTVHQAFHPALRIGSPLEHSDSSLRRPPLSPLPLLPPRSGGIASAARPPLPRLSKSFTTTVTRNNQRMDSDTYSVRSGNSARGFRRTASNISGAPPSEAFHTCRSMSLASLPGSFRGSRQASMRASLGSLKYRSLPSSGLPQADSIALETPMSEAFFSARGYSDTDSSFYVDPLASQRATPRRGVLPAAADRPSVLSGVAPVETDVSEASTNSGPPLVMRTYVPPRRVGMPSPRRTAEGGGRDSLSVEQENVARGTPRLASCPPDSVASSVRMSSNATSRDGARWMSHSTGNAAADAVVLGEKGEVKVPGDHAAAMASPMPEAPLGHTSSSGTPSRASLSRSPSPGACAKESTGKEPVKSQTAQSGPNSASELSDTPRRSAKQPLAAVGSREAESLTKSGGGKFGSSPLYTSHDSIESSFTSMGTAGPNDWLRGLGPTRYHASHTLVEMVSSTDTSSASVTPQASPERGSPGCTPTKMSLWLTCMH